MRITMLANSRSSGWLLGFWLVAFFSIRTVHADVNWDGDGSQGNFSWSENWYGNTVPSLPSNFSAGNLVFNVRNNASQLNQFYDWGWANVMDVIWETTWAVPTTFNGNGNGLNFNQRLENRSSQTVTIGTMNFSGGKNGATQIELNPANGDLILNGNIYNDNNLRYKVYGANNKMLTVNTALSGNSTVALDIEQYSKVKITAAQTMGTGAAYNIRQGELWISGNGSLANGSTINLGQADNNTAKLYLDGANDGHAITVANTGGTKVIGVLDSSATRTLSGNVTLNGGVLLEATQAGGTIDFTGTLSGNSGVTISGAGTVKLSGANTFTGGTTVSSGTLLLGGNDRLANAGALTVNGGTLNLGGFSDTVGATSFGGGSVTNGTITGTGYTATAGTVAAALAGTGGLTKSGTGILFLSGANTYSGSTTVNAGAIELQHNTALGATSGGTTVNDGGQLKLFSSSGINVAENIGLTGLGVSSGGAILSTGGTNILSGNLTVNGNTRINTDISGGSGSLTLSGSISGGTNVLYFGANGSDTAVSGGISGSGATQNSTVTSVYKDGTNGLTLSGNNSYTGDTRIAQGNLTVSGSGNLGSGSDVFITSGGSLTINANATVASVQEWGTTNGGTISLGSGATLTVNGADKGTMYQNSISGAGGLTMSGSGTSTLSLYGTQGYTGSTTVSGGKISSGVALASTNITVSGGTFETSAANVVADTSTVNMSSGTYALNGSDTVGSLNMTGGLLSTTNSSTLTAANYNLNGGTVNANLGSGSLLTASGSSTLSGTVAATSVGVSGGLLTLGSSGRLASGAGVNVSGGELALGGNETVNSVTTSGTGVISGSGLLTAANYNLNGGTVNANLGAGTVTASSGTTSLNGTAAATTVTVNGGTLNTGSANRLADNAGLAVTSGTLGVGGNDTVGSVAISSTGTVSVATGSTLTATANSTISGTGKATGGTLAVGNNANLNLGNDAKTTTSDISIGSGSALTGTGGTTGKIGGGGLLSAGNSPGILTAGQVDVSGGLDFAFEFTGSGAPTYSLAGNSRNDLLHLTNGSNPFVGSFSTANNLSFYFNDSSLLGNLVAINPTTYLGGFYVDSLNFDIASLLSAATKNFYVADANGLISFNGVSYALMSSDVVSRVIFDNANQTSSDFATGTTSGTVLSVTMVPEPSSASLLTFALSGLLALRRRRNA